MLLKETGEQSLQAGKLETRNLTLELTNACNLRCEFCTIWAEREKQILPLGKILKFITSEVFNHPLRTVTITGGEVFLYPHIGRLFKSLVALKLKRYLKTIAISSNGYDTNKILAFLDSNSDYLKDVEMFISLDGSRNTHNKVRGREDAYDKTLLTLETVARKFPELKLYVKFTISEDNYKDINEVYEFCKKNKIGILFKLLEKSNSAYYQRYYHLNEQPVLTERVYFSEDVKNDIIKSLRRIMEEESSFKAPIANFTYINALIEYLQGEFRIERCFTPRYYMFVTSQGYIYPCLYQNKISILQDGWEEKFKESGYLELLNNAESGKCPGCLAYHGYLKYWNFKK